MKVSIPEAIRLTGKSRATIYRFVKDKKHQPYVDHEENAIVIDAAYLQTVYPFTFLAQSKKNASREKQRHVYYQGEGYREEPNHYKSNVNASTVDSRPDNERVSVAYLASQETVHEKDRLQQYANELLKEKESRIEDLKTELTKKDQIILTLSTSNQNLHERLRETNINLQTLQQAFNQMVKELPGSRPASSTSQDPLSTQSTLKERLIAIAIWTVTLLSIVLFGMVLWNYVGK